MREEKTKSRPQLFIVRPITVPRQTKKTKFHRLTGILRLKVNSGSRLTAINSFWKSTWQTQTILMITIAMVTTSAVLR